MTITVNLSARQMVDGNFINVVKRTLESTALHADRLVLELTESMLVGRSNDTLALLHRIRGLGVRIAIDDFGAGYTSFKNLKALKVDIVTARALAPMEKLLGYAQPCLSRGAQGLFLKGEKAELELQEASRVWQVEAHLTVSRSDPRGRIVTVRSAKRRG